MNRDRNELLERIEHDLPVQPDALERLRDRRDEKSRRGRVTAGVVGIGLTAAIFAGVLSWTGDDPDRVEPRGSAVSLTAEPGEYYYERSYAWYPGDSTGGGVGETWIAPDGSGRAEAKGAVYREWDGRYGPGEFPADFLPELSVDPAVMREQLVQRGSPSGASPNPIASSSPGRTQESTTLFRTLQDLFVANEVILTPTQLAAAFQVAQELDEVDVEHGLLDPYGRVAVRVSWIVDYDIGPGSRVEWYFEPSTGQFMGQLWVNQGTDEVEAASLVEHAGIVSSFDERPGPGASYVPEGTRRPDLTR